MLIRLLFFNILFGSVKRLLGRMRSSSGRGSSHSFIRFTLRSTLRILLDFDVEWQLLLASIPDLIDILARILMQLLMPITYQLLLRSLDPLLFSHYDDLLLLCLFNAIGHLIVDFLAQLAEIVLSSSGSVALGLMLLRRFVVAENSGGYVSLGHS